MMERLGKCRYCDYEPIASTARACPKCGGASPFEGGFPWLMILLLVMAAVIAGGAYWILNM